MLSLTMLLLGVAAGLTWLWLAQPAQWEVREGGIVLTEAGSTGQFSVVVLFVVIGAVVSVAWAAVVGWTVSDLGWLLTPIVVVLTALAALIAWRIGVELGPPSPETVTGVSVGDRIPAELSVDGVTPFVVWPIFGLLGVLAVTWADRRGLDQPEPVEH